MEPIWSELLNVEGVDHGDSFFDLGGHSLLASKLAAALTTRLAEQLGGRAVTPLDIFGDPSVRALSEALAPRAEPQASAAPTPSAPAAGRVDLALVGMAGMFPGAGDVETFWSMLAEGRDALTLWTAAELRAKGVGDDVVRHPSFVPAAYMVQGVELFDAGFWGISPHEARIMDPQHRTFMQGETTTRV